LRKQRLISICREVDHERIETYKMLQYKLKKEQEQKKAE